MFFRREKLHHNTFEERIANLKQFGFESRSETGGRVRVTRRGCGAMIENAGDGEAKFHNEGILIGDEIAEMLNGGFQMFFRTPSGVEHPAQAHQLKALHAFDEDLREGLGLTSLYNQGLGTTAEAHMYDRIVDRDAAPHKHPWDKTA
jgi:hypothetical protein